METITWSTLIDDTATDEAVRLAAIPVQRDYWLVCHRHDYGTDLEPIAIYPTAAAARQGADEADRRLGARRHLVVVFGAAIPSAAPGVA